MSFWNRILLIFGLILGIFFYGKNQGRKNEKSKSDAMLLDDIVKTQKRKEQYRKTPYATKLEWLRSYDKSK